MSCRAAVSLTVFALWALTEDGRAKGRDDQHAAPQPGDRRRADTRADTLRTRGGAAAAAGSRDDLEGPPAWAAPHAAPGIMKVPVLLLALLRVLILVLSLILNLILVLV